ncbi:MAG: secondary thiamine-phosphate synthase enzyme [Desulfuromonas sp. SDB]|nr:MAG: secondary thiamine-phosphate synthase enzyme [Desulfuromonas sp. SDB]
MSTQGNKDIIDITEKITEILNKSELQQGLLNVFINGSTGALTTIEFESGLLEDFKLLWKKLIPSQQYYHHHDKWQDGNGHSHLRASLIGPSLTIPFNQGKLNLGTWQQVVFIDFDNVSRNRSVQVNLIGKR